MYDDEETPEQAYAEGLDDGRREAIEEAIRIILEDKLTDKAKLITAIAGLF